MPVILRVGPTEPVPISASVFRLEIPGVFGFEPLGRLADSVEFTGELPPPVEGPHMSWNLHSYEMDEEPERFSTLISAPWGTFLPDNPNPSVEDEFGDLDALLRQALDLAQYLSGPPTLGEALAEIGHEPYATEWFSLLALIEAARMARHLNLPLSLWEWRFPLKPPEHPLWYLEARYWGFQSYSAASLADDGRRLDLEFPGGYRYQLPLDYVATWKGGPRPGLRAVSCHLESEGVDAMVEMEDGTEHQISTVSMLAACEPAYEHFGAWNEESQKYIREGYARFGPFRVFPPEP